MKHCKNQLTMLIIQYYCKTLSILHTRAYDLISGPLTEVIQTVTQNGVARFMQIFGS